MKKRINLLVLLSLSFILVACGQSYHEQLQANDWQVVSTNGESYTASFQNDTVITTVIGIEMGQPYSIDEEKDQISFYKADNSEEETVASTYNISQEGDEINFISANDETKEQYGDLTLYPIEDTSDSN